MSDDNTPDPDQTSPSPEPPKAAEQSKAEPSGHKRVTSRPFSPYPPNRPTARKAPAPSGLGRRPRARLPAQHAQLPEDREPPVQTPLPMPPADSGQTPLPKAPIGRVQPKPTYAPIQAAQHMPSKAPNPPVQPPTPKAPLPVDRTMPGQAPPSNFPIPNGHRLPPAAVAHLAQIPAHSRQDYFHSVVGAANLGRGVPLQQVQAPAVVRPAGPGNMGPPPSPLRPEVPLPTGTPVPEGGTPNSSLSAYQTLENFGRLLSGDALTITLPNSPPPRNHFVLSKTLLRNYSIFFVQYLDNSPNATHLILPDVDADIFTILLVLMYTTNYHPSLANYPPSVDLEAQQRGLTIIPSMRVWVLGRLLGSCVFMNAAMVQLKYSLGHIWRVTAENTDWVWSNTIAGDDLRQFILDVIADYWDGEAGIVCKQTREDQAAWMRVADRFPDVRKTIMFERGGRPGTRMRPIQAYLVNKQNLENAIRINPSILLSAPQPHEQVTDTTEVSEQTPQNTEQADKHDANDNPPANNTPEVVMSSPRGSPDRPIKVDD